MDIQREREAFEATQNTKVLFERIEYIASMDAYMPKHEFANNLMVMQSAERFNFGWSMWKSATDRAKKKLEGCVVVPVELSESIAEKLALEKVEKPRQENDVVWQEIADRSYKDHLIQKKWEIIRNYKELVEAVRGGNE